MKEPSKSSLKVGADRYRQERKLVGKHVGAWSFTPQKIVIKQ